MQTLSGVRSRTLLHAVLPEEMFEGSARLIEGLTQHGHLIVTQLKRGGGVLPPVGLKGARTKFLDPLKRRMQDDEGVAGVTLELQEHRVFPHDPDRRKIHRHLLAALRASHLLANSEEYLLEGVRIELHYLQYTTNRISRQKNPARFNEAYRRIRNEVESDSEIS